jgi:hypothetical protein
MRRAARMAALVVVAGLVWSPSASAEGLEGEAGAVALAERMLETLGGRSAWGRAQTIRVELRGYYARELESWKETFWMSLEAPRGRFELKGPTTDRVIAWSPEGGWELDHGKLDPLTEERHRFELAYWARQPVVIFHRLALERPRTRVEPGDGEGRFDVLDAGNGERLAQFAVNAKGEPIKWAASIGEDEFEHVFGPLATYGDIRLPKWGATIGGIWRYEHEAVALGPGPLPVSLEPPSESGAAGRSPE